VLSTVAFLNNFFCTQLAQVKLLRGFKIPTVGREASQSANSDPAVKLHPPAIIFFMLSNQESVTCAACNCHC